MHYAIETIIFESGERFPMLISAETDMPEYFSTLYAAIALRPKLTVNSMIHHLKAIKVLYRIGERQQINYVVRMLTCDWLHVGEIEQLSAEIRKTVKELEKPVTHEDTVFLRALAEGKIPKIEKYLSWKRVSKQIEEVGDDSGATRLRYVKEYLQFISSIGLKRPIKEDGGYYGNNEDRDQMIKNIEARISDPWGKYYQKKRLGLSDEGRKILFEILEPEDSRNPWENAHVKYRNCVILCVFINVGLRRGELAGLKIKDINFGQGLLRVIRRHDDPEDKRKEQAVQKTFERELILGESLSELISDYISDFRNKIRIRKKHPYIFVETRNGNAISLQTINSICRDLQKASPLLAKLTPHMLRHTFNYDLSKKSDKNGWSEAEEDKVRKYLNGWAKKSAMTIHYNQRRIIEKANEAALEMQNEMPAIKGIGRR